MDSFYFVPIVGDGLTKANGRRPDLPAGTVWHGHDCGSKMVVCVQGTSAEHAALRARPGVMWLGDDPKDGAEWRTTMKREGLTVQAESIEIMGYRF